MDRYIKGIIPLTITNKIVPHKKNPKPKVSVSYSSNHNFLQIKPKKSQLTPFGRKEKRKFTSEKSLDLHGYTREEAYIALIRFFESCQNEGVKQALVITGGNDLRNTTIRKSFQIWVKENFGNYISSCTPANIWHGGEGAFYVRIKKPTR